VCRVGVPHPLLVAGIAVLKESLSLAGLGPLGPDSWAGGTTPTLGPLVGAEEPLGSE